MNILLTAILIANVALLTLVFIAFRSVSRTYSNLRSEFHAFISPGRDDKGEATPSPLATITLALADQAGRSVVSSLKASFMGQASGASRAEKSAEADLQLDMIGAVNPGIGAIISGIPALRKIAKKNPGLIEAAVSRFTTKGNAVITTSTSGNTDNFKL